jgi:hypothetical protein
MHKISSKSGPTQRAANNWESAHFHLCLPVLAIRARAARPFRPGPNGVQAGILRGLELVPSKWRCLIPPTSPLRGLPLRGVRDGYPCKPRRPSRPGGGQAANRWAALMEEKELFT